MSTRQGRNQLVGKGQKVGNGLGRGAFIEAGIFLGGADQDAAIRTGHQITRSPEEDTAKERRASIQKGNLAAHRPYRNCAAEGFQERPGPGAGSK